MINLIKLTLTILCIFSFQVAIAVQLEYSPVGLWKTIDDVTGKPKAIIEISKTPNNTLQGRILKIYPEAGRDQNELCTACTGDKHNQRMVGLVILENLKKNLEHANLWENGKILDPKNGKTYHCNIQALNAGNKLNVHGYIGLPLFGRTQKWVKVQNLV